MNVKHDNILVIPDPVPDMIGSFHLPDEAKRYQSERGTVYATGPGIRYGDSYIPVCVSKGDRIMYRIPAREVTIGDDKFVMIQDADVLMSLDAEAERESHRVSVLEA